MHSLKFRWTLSVTPSTGVDQFVRYMVVLDKQPNGLTPAWTDVLVSTSVQSQLNLSNQSRFRVLLDRLVYLNAAAEPGSGSDQSFSLSLGDVVQYNSGTAGTVADIATNSLYLFTLSTAPAGQTAGLSTGVARLRYTDE